MKRLMIGKKIFWAGILLICFCCSATYGQTIKYGQVINKAFPCPQDINEKELMDTAIRECQKLGYSSEQEGGKVVLTKGYVFSCVGSIGMSNVLYKITPAFATGEDGRKVFTLGGEYIGKPIDKGHRGECFECEMDQIEKTVKKHLESN